MISIPLVLALLLCGGGDSDPDPWRQIQLTISRDPYTSSDHVTLCRVRAVNAGSRRWQGRALVFEARGLDGGSVVRERGRFGMMLEPYGSLETLIALPGRHMRVEVSPVPASEAGGTRGARPKKPRAPKKPKRPRA